MERPRHLNPDSVRNKRPDNVQRSVLGGNVEHLRMAGRKGAMAANRAKEIEKHRDEVRQDTQSAVDAEYAERAAAHAQEKLKETNEHLLDADGLSPNEDERPEQA